MLDLSPNWPSVSLTQPNVVLPGITVRTLPDLGQHLVSGNLESWRRLSGVGDGIGALALATGTAYALRIARDRMLIVNAPADTVEGGWHTGGFAVTDASAGLCVIELHGDRLSRIVRRAVALDPNDTSPSAACGFAGVTALVYHHGDRDTIRLHVDRSLAPHVLTWLELNGPTMAGDF